MLNIKHFNINPKMQATINKIKSILTKVSANKPLPVSDQTQLHQLVTTVKTELNKNHTDDTLNIHIDILQKYRLGSDDKQKIINDLPNKLDKILKILSDKPNGPEIKEGEEEEVEIKTGKQEEPDIKNDIRKDNIEPGNMLRLCSIDINSADLSIDIIEKGYNDNIEYYKHDADHPMVGVTKYVHGYRAQYNRTGSKHKNIEDACKKMIDISMATMTAETPLCSLITKDIIKGYCRCGDMLLIVYWYNNDPYFNIRHIIHILGIKDVNDKIRSVKNDIKHIYFNKNTFGGYDLCELIAEDAMIRIIMESKTAFADHFKVNISKMIVMLRKNGIICLDKKGEFVINKEFRKSPENVKNANNESMEMTIVTNLSDRNTFMEKTITQTLTRYTVDNKIAVTMFALDIIVTGSKISIWNYLKKSVMYFFVISLTDESGTLLCKIGYSADILQRYHDLKNEYGCNFYLAGIKGVESIQTEKAFHTMIKQMHPQIHYGNVKVKDKYKDELYYLCDTVYDEFKRVHDNIIQINNYKQLTKDELEMDQYFKDQPSIFITFKNITYMNDLKCLAYMNESQLASFDKSHSDMTKCLMAQYQITSQKYEAKITSINKEFDIEKLRLEDKKLQYDIEYKKLADIQKQEMDKINMQAQMMKYESDQATLRASEKYKLKHDTAKHEQEHTMAIEKLKHDAAKYESDQLTFRTLEKVKTDLQIAKEVTRQKELEAKKKKH